MDAVPGIRSGSPAPRSRMCGLQQTDPVESLRTVGESLGGVCRIEERQLAVEHRTHPGAECRGFFCSIGEFGNHLVHDAAREEIGRPDSLPGGQAGVEEVMPIS